MLQNCPYASLNYHWSLKQASLKEEYSSIFYKFCRAQNARSRAAICKRIVAGLNTPTTPKQTQTLNLKLKIKVEGNEEYIWDAFFIVQNKSSQNDRSKTRVHLILNFYKTHSFIIILVYI